MNLSKNQIDLLNSKKGFYYLLKDEKLDLKKAIENIETEDKFENLNQELIRLQNWVLENDKKILIFFEGRDAAGKGGSIRKVTSHLNPRHYRALALPKPSLDEENQWYFQRYLKLLPKSGDIVFFDRSWYNRAIIEPVYGFCKESEYTLFMEQVNNIEKMIVDSGIKLIKIYLKISKEEQAKRFEKIRSHELTSWKLSDVDKKAQILWDNYTEYEKIMLDKTSTDYAPWKIVDANNTNKSNLEIVNYILSENNYD